MSLQQMIKNDVHDLAEFEQIRRETLARIYELILSLPVNENAGRDADNDNDRHQGNGCETRSFGILPPVDTDEIKGGEIR